MLGGGYTGIELAQAYCRFGSRVTIIEPGPQLMAREDPDATEEINRILSDEGIQIILAANPISIHGRSGEQITVTARTSAGEQEITGSDLLVAIGRIPQHGGHWARQCRN